MDGCGCPLLNEFRARVISPKIFVCCKRAIARKIAENFICFAVNCTFYDTCSTNDVSRVPLLCFFVLAFEVIVGL